MNITELQKLNDLPLPLNPLRLNNGSGIEQTLVENGAKYHPSCYLLFSNTQLQRAKRGRNQAHVTLTLRKVGQKGATSTQSKMYVSYVRTCVKLKEMANSVNDIRLTATLSGPDAIALELKYHTNVTLI